MKDHSFGESTCFMRYSSLPLYSSLVSLSDIHVPFLMPLSNHNLFWKWPHNEKIFCIPNVIYVMNRTQSPNHFHHGSSILYVDTFVPKQVPRASRHALVQLLQVGRRDVCPNILHVRSPEPIHAASRLLVLGESIHYVSPDVFDDVEVRKSCLATLKQ